ncbi:MAG TPA: desulfoferrodoxin family protein, partial [Negativicutes bacterium]|nr:desulfoferrodoxin family protein [Negativicutes bacterium]
NMSDIGFYRCEQCGNVLAMLKNESLTRSCCSKTLTKLEPNSTDGEKEQHIPFITQNGEGIKVAVGSILHPMLPEHHIEWIALESEKKTVIIYISAGKEPRAAFSDIRSGVVYTYCNLHGLWEMAF